MNSRPAGGFPARRSGLARRRARAGVGFVAPNVLAVLVFLLFPLGFSLYLSFHSWDLFRPMRAVGWGNYRQLFADPLFYIALRNTGVFTVATLAPTVAISLVAAAALNRKLRGIGVFRTLAFLPLVASTVAMAVVWRFLFTTDGGAVNLVLGRVGLGPVPWLGDPDWALLALSIVTVWKSLPFATVVLLAAMQGIPENLYEAAKIDGAGPLRRFGAITVPLIRGALSFVFVITIINSVQAFDQAYALTDGNGGPETGTFVLGIMLFQNAFRFYEIGYAAALAWVMFAMLLVLTLVQLWLARREPEDR
ncbi:sugar ABC transporter permease [Nocardia terpenica]|uniref:carbohydrate ABC transporter permease n=1 Tax=Nocardia terpenica TaxID=455432 RepID=UPI001892DD3F|nr:sugar ABC transporter permease [Nocardia terpenica]MBF6060781.1 sugar ABC transporter permease [Nocardia terpenica]MBF6104041.1 sugar ABC transporter permease [Nocardia terpenica]MBF6111585.1 sugar ABC transporter permease [Nocardia terpenica]MBF6118262.1 sugar ABC transporter permease [Nocardia terpenica]MBF6156113.1 sugar ABC transporter permease [Nocardia terpenica]